MMAREFWTRDSAGASDDGTSGMENLVARFDELVRRVARLEADAERMSAQILFTEKALASCLEREKSLHSNQSELRTELLSKVRGLTTE